MPKKDSPKPGAQHTHFTALARELGCEESETAFNASLEKLARVAVPRKPAVAAKALKPQRTLKTELKVPGPAKKKIRFTLPGA
jgi:hypothetical protein